MQKIISGFSKLSKHQKIEWLTATYFSDADKAKATLQDYWNTNTALQQLHDEFSENSISNYYLPFGVAPNFIINQNAYTIPMVVEESSVVAAASNAAKFWQKRGGFSTKVISTTKIGHVHFTFTGPYKLLSAFFNAIKPHLVSEAKPLTENMEKRGGGIKSISLVNKSAALNNYYQLQATFDTKDAMGANFINSCLEQFAATLKREFKKSSLISKYKLEVIMSILSNYVPDCLVRAEVNCDLSDLKTDALSGAVFAEKFLQAIAIAEIEPYRAVTHNKGIMNGIDAVVVATGNDFRAVEAGVHAFAARHGSYSSLTHAEISGTHFKFWIEVPLALGTVGGLTRLHPLVKFALELLEKPSAEKLMEITAVAGLAQNFAAIRSLITTGIQKGHMKMHLMNILNQFKASKEEINFVKLQFEHKPVTVSEVKSVLETFRQNV